MNFYNIKKNNCNADERGGFTLIELLVVIAIIGLLSSIVMTSLNDARAKARNSKRNQMALQYINALELYRDSSATKNYPVPSGGSENSDYYCIGNWPGGCWTGIPHDDDLNASIGEYLPGIPKNDEVLIDSDGNNYSGTVYNCIDTDCSNYLLWWYLEGKTIKNEENIIESSEVTCPRGVVQNEAGDISYCRYYSSN